MNIVNVSSLDELVESVKNHNKLHGAHTIKPQDVITMNEFYFGWYCRCSDTLWQMSIDNLKTDLKYINNVLL